MHEKVALEHSSKSTKYELEGSYGDPVHEFFSFLKTAKLLRECTKDNVNYVLINCIRFHQKGCQARLWRGLSLSIQVSLAGSSIILLTTRICIEKQRESSQIVTEAGHIVKS